MITSYNKAVENIRTQLYNYLNNSKLNSLVVGVSGGIDSALTVVLAKPVCDKLNIPLIGRSITIVTNKPDEISRARNIGTNFCSDFKEIDLSENFNIVAKTAIEDFDNENKNSFDYKIRLGNIKARLRMMYLYDLAGKNKGMVLSTDNYTELLLGFWTLHGDVGDYGMIQNIWKTEVYEMSEYLASKMKNNDMANALLDCVSAVATDGLGITNSDLDQIGASSYKEVDQILIKLLDSEKELGEYKNHKVVLRKINSEFKRNNPYNIPRKLITGESL